MQQEGKPSRCTVQSVVTSSTVPRGAIETFCEAPRPLCSRCGNVAVVGRLDRIQRELYRVETLNIGLRAARAS